MRPIMFHKIPQDRQKDIAHLRVVCDVKLTKKDPNRTHITIGGNTIAYLGDCGTKTGAIEVVKGIFNSVCSQPGAKFLSADITNLPGNTTGSPPICAYPHRRYTPRVHRRIQPHAIRPQRLGALRNHQRYLWPQTGGQTSQ
jgi:hypothetical protein